MAHTHEHGHEHGESYFLDQIFTIALCGALGAIAVLLYVRKGMLTLVLSPSLHPYLLFGGIGLLLMVAIRAVAVWRLAGQASNGTAHAHDHGHEDHPHDHAHGHAHDHAHGHDHDHCDHAHCTTGSISTV